MRKGKNISATPLTETLFASIQGIFNSYYQSRGLVSKLTIKEIKNKMKHTLYGARLVMNDNEGKKIEEAKEDKRVQTDESAESKNDDDDYDDDNDDDTDNDEESV